MKGASTGLKIECPNCRGTGRLTNRSAILIAFRLVSNLGVAEGTGWRDRMVRDYEWSVEQANNAIRTSVKEAWVWETKPGFYRELT